MGRGRYRGDDQTQDPNQNPRLNKRLIAWIIGTRALMILGVYYGSAGSAARSFGSTWTEWDSYWYLQIASNGYNKPASRAFFPAFPGLIRIASLFSKNSAALTAVGLTVSSLCFFAALRACWLLARQRSGREVADRMVVVLCLIPLQVVFHSIYGESFALLCAAVVLLLVRRTLVGAGIAAVGVGLSRSIGGPIGAGWIIAALFSEKNVLRRASKRVPTDAANKSVSLRGRFIFVGILAGLSATAVMARVSGGTGVQANFSRAWNWPWIPIWRDITSPTWSHGQVVSVIGLLLAAAYIFSKSADKATRFAVCIMMLFHLSLARQVSPYTGGAMRYLMPFPLVWEWIATRTLGWPRQIQMATAVFCLTLVGAASFWAGAGSFVIG
jgi:Mannosyltransferase (PIG-V)